MDKIIRYFLKPHRIIFKIFDKVNLNFQIKKYDQSYFEKKQNETFNFLGLNREQGVKNLDLLKKDLNFDSDTIRDMSSEHEVIFSCLSLNKDFKIKDILEIGTFDGFNALLLSNLFKDSQIDTIDLPEKDEDFVNFYNRKNNVDKFIEERNKNLAKNTRIKFLPLNSLKLLNHKKKYDLIWIDGAHGYPVVCSDIINSLHLLKDNGVILCDDIILNLNQYVSDKMHYSIASYETLNELKKQKLIKFTLVFKRLSAEANSLENKRKYIGVVSKI